VCQYPHAIPADIASYLLTMLGKHARPAVQLAASAFIALHAGVDLGCPYAGFHRFSPKQPSHKPTDPLKRTAPGNLRAYSHLHSAISTLGRTSGHFVCSLVPVLEISALPPTGSHPFLSASNSSVPT